MISYEKNVAAKSDYFVYTASITAKKMFFYPLHIGYFFYEPNYYIKRSSFDSFLIMHITKGNCTFRIHNTEFKGQMGDVVLLDCYQPHEYGSDHSWEASWMHFDGPLARDYYELIVAKLGNVIVPQNLADVEQGLSKICNTFRNGTPIREALFSKYITIMLTQLLLSAPPSETPNLLFTPLEHTISYINEHFTESLSLEFLAKKAHLSPYYFTRVFHNQTGLTPHQYIIATRLNSSKFLLKTTNLSVKEIAFNSGFISESSFCSTFKKWEGLTPSEYRILDASSFT